MKNEYIINENIDKNQINEFVNDYKSLIEKKESELEYSLQPIKIIFQPDLTLNEKEELLENQNGLIDPLFLSYVSLFLKEFSNAKITFILNNTLTQSRGFSLSTQIEHFIATFGLKNRLLLNGSFIVKETQKSKKINLSDRLSHSQKFIPPIYINNKKISIEKYFNSNNKPKTGIFYDLLNEYKIKIIELINYWGFEEEDRNSIKSNNYIKKLKIDQLSFIELTFYLLLINRETYLPIGGKGVSELDRRKRKEKNLTRFPHYVRYVKEISKGLKELALNIQEHSGSKGVITARIYDDTKLKLLKGTDSYESDFLNSTFDNSYYRNDKARFFIDINVIDFGKTSISDKYVANLTRNKKDNKIIGISLDRLDNDIKIIKKMKYKDFFVIGENYFQLEHQQNKLISRYGLHHFTHIIKNELNGFIKTSTQAEGITIFNNSSRVNKRESSFVTRGTSYNCIIPLKINFEEEFKLIKKEKEKAKNALEINTFKDLDNYKEIDLDSTNIDLSGKIPIYKFPSKNQLLAIKKHEKEIKTFDFDEKKYLQNYNLYRLITETNKYSENCILLIDSKKISISNESNWTRLLSALNEKFNDIIVYNTSYQEVIEIKKIREKLENNISSNNNISDEFYKQYRFWLDNSRVLFYSYKKHRDKVYQRFGATLLTGATSKQFELINSNIGHHHYNFGPNSGMLSKNIDRDINLPRSIYNNNLFHNEKLKYFELIITNTDKYNSKMSLFEESVQYSLNTIYRPEQKETSNKGYKIKDTHFRLGSKIHITDFFYGKRLFQNSFFTTPLAYKLAEYLIQNNTLKANNNYSIIGYDKYSDFLSSTIKNLLEKRKPKNVKLSHFTISKDGILSRDKHNLYSNTIILVPIAATFSTSIKIKKDIDRILENIKGKKEKQSVVSYLNILLVGHKTSMNKKGNTLKITQKKDNILHNFNWQLIDKTNKIIEVNPFDKKEITLQKYFIPLLTEWSEAHNCEYCFNSSKERCLIETSSASVTPQLIFGYPKTKLVNDTAVKIINNERIENKLDLRDSLLYGNLKKNNNSYLYFTKTGSIINKQIKENGELVFKNQNNIISWLKYLKENIFDKLKNEKIVIVTPISGSKSNFLDLVNEHLFEYTANCLFISLEEDYIENAEFLYSDGLQNASTVIFVDDVLSTVKSFLEVNYIVKYIRNKPKSGKGIDYCLSLINRMSYDNENNLILKLVPLDNEFNLKDGENKLLYYTKINNPSIEEPNNIFPLKKEKDRYELLSSISSLDSIRSRFNNKKLDLRTNDLSKEIKSKIFDHKRDWKYKKLNQLLVLNSIYSLFEYQNDEHIKKADLIQIFKNLDFELLESKINNSLKKEPSEHKNNVIDLYSRNRKYTLLKIICSTPLIYYQEIRTASFVWINDELKNLIKDFKTDSHFIENFFKIEQNEYSNYQVFKFLLKRSVELKSNLIISLSFFNSIKHLIDSIGGERNILDDLCSNSLIKLTNKFNDSNVIGKYHLAKYINKNKNCFSPIKFEEFWKSIDFDKVEENQKKHLKSKEGKLNLIDEFDDTFYDIINSTELYYYTNSKKMILYLVSLIQELVLEHETKSAKLEENLDRIIKLKKLEFKNNNKNGNYLHYLRLLKLENTEIAYKFWEEFKKEKTYGDKRKEIPSQIDFTDYEENPKFKLLTGKGIDANLVSKVSYKAYCNAKTKLHNIEIKNKNGYIENENENISDDIQKLLNECCNIIGNVKESYLAVNFNKKKKTVTTNDIFIFENKKNKQSAKGILNDIENSLTLEMFNLDRDKSQFSKTAISNFEVYKNTSDDVKPKHRENYLKIDVRNFNECKQLRNCKYSILLVRISDFYKDSNIKKSNNENDKNKLYTQAVLTFYLDKGERIAEEKLRLILLLRKSFSQFFKNEISTNTFLELLQLNKLRDYQRKLKHGVGGLLDSQYGIISEYEDIRNKTKDKDDYDHIVDSTEADDRLVIKYATSNYFEFQIMNNLIGSQAGLSLKSVTQKKIFFFEYFEKMVVTIFKSDRFDSSIKHPKQKPSLKFKKFETYSILIDSVIPELIINQKKYGEQCEIKCNDTSTYLELNFSNIVKSKGNDDGYGQDLCREIINNLKNVTITFPEKIIKNELYLVKVKITK